MFRESIAVSWVTELVLFLTNCCQTIIWISASSSNASVRSWSNWSSSSCFSGLAPSFQKTTMIKHWEMNERMVNSKREASFKIITYGEVGKKVTRVNVTARMRALTIKSPNAVE